MNRSINLHQLRWLAPAVCILVCTSFTACKPVQVASTLEHSKHQHGHEASVCDQPTVEALAHDLDMLEGHIEKYGSVVAKQPDVWGQARLTKHREEFEAQMATQLTAFDYTIQGGIFESDQGYFTDALALSAAATPRGSSGSASASSSATAAPNVALPTPTDLSGTFSDANFKRNGVAAPLTASFVGFNAAAAAGATAASTSTGYKIEPTLLLDQRARFINHLHELRRINEGDDTADSPGYALNLVRIPVSVLPGKHTDVGYGAEITVTMSPYLSDELLPTTFRNLVANDLVDQLGFPLTQFINNPDNEPYFAENTAGAVDELLWFLQSTTIDDRIGQASEFTANAHFFMKLAEVRKPELQELMMRPEWTWVDKYIAWFAVTYPNGRPADPSRQSVADNFQKTPRALQKSIATAKSIHIQTQVPVPATKTRRARMPFPPSQMGDVFGYDFDRMVVDAYRAFAKEKYIRPCPTTGSPPKISPPVVIHLPDVQGYLQEEIASARKFLDEPAQADLWEAFCTPTLVGFVRNHNDAAVELQRMEFKNRIQQRNPSEGAKNSLTSVLAWAIIVESALLNDQLIQDMRETASTKGCGCLRGEWLPYYLPNPPPEARQAFNEYVRCRWPIHVFALDPAAQQQNIIDTFSGRREMQLALSMGFVSGKVSGSNLMRYARRIEYDLATVDLNGTEIGFSHGDDTFGWRFYPRFQTPDIESNSKVFFRDLLIGGPNRNELLRMRRLEPGIRECDAVVIMPSFVPYATFSTSVNWFKLTNPKSKELDSTDAMRLSRLAKEIDSCAPHVVDGQCYRDGDLSRLYTKAKQLESRLPLQSNMVQIPYENTLGGFAMFNTGVTDLAPELTGWYGSEAVDPANPTVLFLVGNHFSVQSTRVIAGGLKVTDVEQLSRQVMRVTIPPKQMQIGDQTAQFVDVQLATPYGVSQHLLIPVCKTATPAGTSSNAIAWQTSTVDVGFSYSGIGIIAAATSPTYRPTNLVLGAGGIDTSVYKDVAVTLNFKTGTPKVDVTGHYNSANGGYVISGQDFTSQLFGAVGSSIGPEATNPATSLTVNASIRPVGPGAASQEVQTPLIVNLIKAAGK